MADLGFISTASVIFGQTLTFALTVPQTHPVSYAQSASGQSDVLIINNLSPCTFSVTMQPTGRSFTLPAGVPTNPLPLGLRGVYDDTVQLLIENISTGSFANQVHFDWFSANEPVLYVGSNASSTGSISLTNITAGTITANTEFIWSVGGIGSTFPAVFALQPSGATVNNLWSIVYGGPDGSFRLFNNTAGNTAIEVDPTDAIQISNGPISNLNGQATVGSYGTAPIVAQKIAQNVVATGLTTILTYTPSTACYLRLNGMIDVGDTTPEKQVFQVTYTPQHGSSATKNFTAVVGTAVVPLDGATNGALASGNHACQPLDITSAASSTITISYNNPGGTVNDFVTAIIERLA